MDVLAIVLYGLYWALLWTWIFVVFWDDITGWFQWRHEQRAFRRAFRGWAYSLTDEELQEINAHVRLAVRSSGLSAEDAAEGLRLGARCGFELGATE